MTGCPGVRSQPPGAQGGLGPGPSWRRKPSLERNLRPAYQFRPGAGSSGPPYPAPMPERWIEVRLLAPEPWCELIAEELATWTGGAAAFGRPSLGWPEAPPGQDWLRAFYPVERDSPAARGELERRLAALVELVDQPDLGALELLFRELPPRTGPTPGARSGGPSAWVGWSSPIGLGPGGCGPATCGSCSSPAAPSAPGATPPPGPA